MTSYGMCVPKGEGKMCVSCISTPRMETRSLLLRETYVSREISVCQKVSIFNFV